MSYPIWHSCLRLSSVIFPVSSVWLFFTPRGSEQTAILAVTAVASAGVWAFCSGHKQTPPGEQLAEDSIAAAPAAVEQAAQPAAVADTAPALPVQARPLAPPRASRLELACEEDDLVGFDFALGSKLYQATQPAAAADGIAAAAAPAPRATVPAGSRAD